MNELKLGCSVPYRMTEEGVEILLITSRGKGDWIFPKGRVEEGDSLQKTAEREALEEAGVLGYVYPQPFASYRQKRQYGCDHVSVFLMSVQQVLEDWSEKSERKRKWVPYDRLRKVLKKETLVPLIPEIERFLKKQAAAA